MKYIIRDREGNDAHIEADIFQAEAHGVLFLKVETVDGQPSRARPVAFVPTGQFVSVRTEDENEVLPSR